MPRDDNGNYTLPSGNPVAPGTTIEDSWANSTLSDIASAITDSLSRTGQGGMQYPLTFGDGTMANPGIAWTNEPGSGFYRAAAGDTRLTLQGYGDTARWYNGLAYVRNAADTAWAAVVYAGGAGSVPAGVANLDTLVWSTASSAWVRQVKNAGGQLPVGSSTLKALQWNNSTLVWDAVAVGSDTNIEDGSATGQIPVWDNTAGAWEANSLLTVSDTNSAVAIGTAMTTATGCSLSVLNRQWVGNTDGTVGVNIGTYSFPTNGVFVSAGSRSATLPNPSPLPMTLSGTSFSMGATTGDIVFNSSSGETKLQSGGVDILILDDNGDIGIGGTSASTSRLRIVGESGDNSLLRVFDESGNELLNVTNNGNVKLLSLATSSSGLPSGTLWRSGTDIKIVP